MITEVACMDIYLPKIFPTMSKRDALVVVEWYVGENEIVFPRQLLVEIDAPVGLIAIPAPPDMTLPHRVAHIEKRQGQRIQLGDLLLRLEPDEQAV
jgi:hypothetical protein